MFNTFASGLRNSIAKLSPVKLIASSAICYFILNKGKLFISNKKMLCSCLPLLVSTYNSFAEALSATSRQSVRYPHWRKYASLAQICRAGKVA